MKIILIHGQGRTPLAMSVLAWRLRHHEVKLFGYVCAYESFERIVDRFVTMVQENILPEPYIVVAHSLGGLITRASLVHLQDHPPAHFVMLGTPNQPATLAQKVGENPLYRVITGDCGQKLAQPDFFEQLPVPQVSTTIVAGTRGIKGGRSPFGDQPNDMVVAVEETKLAPDIPVVEIPAVHTFMMNSKQVAEIVLAVIDDLESDS